MRLDVRADIKQVLKMLDETQHHIVPKAASRALNKTITSVNAEAARQIKADLGNGMPIAAIKAGLTRINATPKKLYAAIYAKGRRIPIIKLNPKARQDNAGVSYKNKGRGRIHIPHAFLATMKNGHRGVFKRKGTARLPITELMGPSLPKVFSNEVILRALERMAKTRWLKVFKHELEYALSKFKK